MFVPVEDREDAESSLKQSGLLCCAILLSVIG